MADLSKATVGTILVWKVGTRSVQGPVVSIDKDDVWVKDRVFVKQTGLLKGSFHAKRHCAEIVESPDVLAKKEVKKTKDQEKLAEKMRARDIGRAILRAKNINTQHALDHGSELAPRLADATLHLRQVLVLPDTLTLIEDFLEDYEALRKARDTMRAIENKPT